MNRYIELKSEENNEFEMEEELLKKYEIYKLKLEQEKIMISNTKYFSNSKEKETYYDKQMAMEIYDNMVDLEEGIENSFPEMLELCQEEIMLKQNRIEELQKKDRERFQDALKTYHLIYKSEVFIKMKNNFNKIVRENYELKEKLKMNTNIIKDLSKKLQISLNRVEELQDTRISLWNKILRKFNRKKLLKD